MATTTGVKFLKGKYGLESAITKATSGAIVFDETSKQIYVDGIAYGGNITDATYANNKLTISKADGTSVELDFSGLATSKSVMAVFNEIATLITPTETAGQYIDAADVDYVDTDALQSLNTDNAIVVEGESADSAASAISKLDNKGKTIINELIKNEKVTTTTFASVQAATGLDKNLTYQPDTTATYINNATSLADADSKLDAAIKNIADNQVSVATTDKILDMSAAKVISSTLTIDIEKQGEGEAAKDYIVLKGKNGAEVSKVDASAFVKDGMIDTVAWKKDAEGHDTNILVVTWNTAAGKTASEINMSKFIDTYTSGDENLLTVAGYIITPQTSDIDEDATGLAKAADVYAAIEAAKTTVDNKAATITVNAADATTIATVGATDITAKAALYWEEYV